MTGFLGESLDLWTRMTESRDPNTACAQVVITKQVTRSGANWACCKALEAEGAVDGPQPRPHPIRLAVGGAHAHRPAHGAVPRTQAAGWARRIIMRGNGRLSDRTEQNKTLATLATVGAPL